MALRITCHPIDWELRYAQHIDEFMELKCYGLDRNSEKTVVRIRNIPISMYIQLPEIVNEQKIYWTADMAGKLYKSIVYRAMNRKFSALNCKPLAYAFKYSKMLYYYTEETKPVMQLIFANTTAMKNVQNMLQYSVNMNNLLPIYNVPGQRYAQVKVTCWETDVDPIRKVMSLMKLKYAQWFNANVYKVTSENDKICNIASEYQCTYRDIFPIAPENTIGWETHPRYISYDIETYSENPESFPNKNFASDVAYMISCTTGIESKPESRINACFVLGDVPESPRADIYCFADEIAMIRAFENYLKEFDPVFITGHNILSYDYPYLDQRLIIRGQGWQELGVLRNTPATLEKARPWSSSGKGYNDKRNLIIPGVLSIDTLPISKEKFKLNNYTLNDVARHCLEKSKHDVPAREMFRIYRRYQNIDPLMQRMEQLGFTYKLTSKSVHKIVQAVPNLSEEVIERLRVYVRDGLTKSYNNNIPPFLNLTLLGQETPEINPAEDDIGGQIKLATQDKLLGFHENRLPFTDVNINNVLKTLELNVKADISLSDLHYLIQLEYDSAMDEMYTVLEYAIEDSFLVTDLNEHIGVWSSIIKSASICGVTPYHFYTGGQQRRAYSLLYDMCVEEDYIIDDRGKTQIPQSGGHTFKPIVGWHKNINCYDYKSLYPSILEAHNLCYTTLIHPNDYHKYNEDQCTIYDWVEPAKKNNPEHHHHYRIIKKEIHFGLIPRLVHLLVQLRRQVQAEIKKLWGEKVALKDRAEDIKNLCIDIPEEERSSWEQKIHENTRLLEEYNDQIESIKEVLVEIPEGDSKRVPHNREIETIKTKIADSIKIIRQAENLLTNCSDEEKIELQIELGKIPALIKAIDIRLGLLDKEQWALKILVNSVYGFVSAQGNEKKKKPRGKKPCAELGIIVCFVGRRSVGETGDYLKEKYGHYIVYGDTDSVMICHHFTDTLEAVASGHAYAKELTKLFPPPMEYEFEKCMMMLCLTKKKYLYFMANAMGIFNMTMKNMVKKGVTSNRRDNCLLGIDTFNLVGFNSLIQRPKEEVYQIMFDAVQRFLRRQVPISQLCKTEALNPTTNDSFRLKVFYNALSAKGKAIEPGTRVTYVVIEPHDYREKLKADHRYKIKAGDRYRLMEEYIDPMRNDSREKFDQEHYLVKCLAKHCDQAFNAGYIKEMVDSNFVKKPNHIYLRIEENPMLAMYLMVEQRRKISECIEYISNYGNAYGYLSAYRYQQITKQKNYNFKDYYPQNMVGYNININTHQISSSQAYAVSSQIQHNSSSQSHAVGGQSTAVGGQMYQNSSSQSYAVNGQIYPISSYQNNNQIAASSSYIQNNQPSVGYPHNNQIAASSSYIQNNQPSVGYPYNNQSYNNQGYNNQGYNNQGYNNQGYNKPKLVLNFTNSSNTSATNNITDNKPIYI